MKRPTNEQRTTNDQDNNKVFLYKKNKKPKKPQIFYLPFFLLYFPQYDDGLHGYMDSGAAAAAMYDPHAGHRPPGLQGLPPHHSPHMSHAAAAATVGMHGYHSGHGTPSHVSPVANHVMGAGPDKRDKDAIYGYVFIYLFI